MGSIAKNPAKEKPQGLESLLRAKLPQELIELDQWVCYRLEWNEERGKNDKKPVNPKNGRLAQSNNPRTWGTFAQAVARVEAGNADGVGFVFSETDPYAGIDLDHCLGEEEADDDGAPTKPVEPWAWEIVERLASYTEVSPSGTGLHIIVRATLPPGGRKNERVEMYDSGRFFTVTGESWGISNVVEARQSEVETLHAEQFPPKVTTPQNGAQKPTQQVDLDDQQLIEKAKNAKNGAHFERLYSGNTNGYGSQSEADLALCNNLAFWTGGDAQRVDRLFRASGLMRDKWNRKAYADGRTYGEATVALAVDTATDFYSPRAYSNGAGPGTSHSEETPAASGYHTTDLGNAQRLVAQHGSDLHYVYRWGQWLIWDDTRWEMDETGEIERRAKHTVRTIYQEAGNAQDSEDRKALAKWAYKSESQNRIGAMIALARSEPGIAVAHTELDANPMLLNVGNGTLDLRTGTLRPHQRQDLTTKRIGTNYDAGAKCPRWLQFLDRILASDQDLIAFVQKAVGYTLTGDVSEQCLFFMHGNGKNGKSTFTETVMQLLGDYAQKAPTEMLIQKNNGPGIPNDIARLPGARFVVAAELEEGKRLAESVVKDLTGGDTMTARFMRQEWFEFQPSHKLWIYGNHKPIIRGTDDGIWRRLRLIPFTVQIPEEEQDPKLKEKLQEELPGILAWAVEGCRQWYAQGLGLPLAVQAATSGYRSEMDALGAYLDENCMIGPRYQVAFKALYADYVEWCETNGERPLGGRRFGNELNQRGYIASKGTGNEAIRLGLGLMAKTEDLPLTQSTTPQGKNGNIEYEL